MSGDAPTEYRPGACNIGTEQRRHRRRLSALTAVLGFGYALGVAILELPTFLLLGVFVPLMLSLEWAIESRRSFCIRLALAGKFAFGEETGTVDEPAARQRDTTAAVRITVIAVIGATVLTGLVYVGISAM